MDDRAAVSLQAGSFGSQGAERELLRNHQQPIAETHRARGPGFIINRP